ncbi:MAG: hypothetical protein OXI81_04920 [Paracoccaceae bacterium]|nr:hypothetical protein [Paracoccaceae bacterium]MDE2911674.1 hypothetical protein [Paracoccaceae bacterium]
MDVVSRCETVLEPNDSPMTVKTALQLINRELDQYSGGFEGEFDANTHLAITWFEQNDVKQANTVSRTVSPRRAASRSIA